MVAELYAESLVESCGDDVGDVLVVELEKWLIILVATIGTQFSVLLCIFCSLIEKCDF